MTRYVMSRGAPRYPGQFGPAKAEVVIASGCRERRSPLTHRVHHSPDGFEWGYGGSGPSELARCILWDWLGSEPRPALYHAFKDRFISGETREEGFEITDDEVAAFVGAWTKEQAEVES